MRTSLFNWPSEKPAPYNSSAVKAVNPVVSMKRNTNFSDSDKRRQCITGLYSVLRRIPASGYKTCT